MARILVVDDNRTVVDMMAGILTMQNHTVETAYDGKHAIEIAQASLPDLILLDVEMPEMDGIEVCRTLRSRPETQLTPIIIVTGRIDTRTLMEAIQAGCDDFLSKPADVPVLQARVESLLKMSRLRNQLKEKERFDYMVNNMRDGIVITDSVGLVQRCNTTAAQMFRIDARELPAKPFLDILDDMFTWKPLPWPTLLEKKHGQFIVYRQDIGLKLRYALRIDYDVLVNPFSEIDEVIFVVSEETERINEERRKDLLVALMTHKFRTIETITQLSLDSLQLLAESPDPHLESAIIQSLRESSRRLTILMHSLLQFLKLPENFREEEKEWITKEWLVHTLKEITGELGKPELSIEQLWGNLSGFNMVEGGLYRILYELVDNAIKFGDKTDLGLAVSVTPNRQNGVILSVFNRGKPIPQEELSRLWNRFYQVDPEFTGQVEGIGLGLSVVKYIVDLSGGTAHTFSTEKGTTVELHFPMEY